MLIHTNTNDEDVNVLEVEHLIQALKANCMGRGTGYRAEISLDYSFGCDKID